ncbi:MAG: alpha/beta fold hydrolase [Elusimicrobia bacterium]|nr:alpha/beta fold hydrolase [Elusimicrobiota bacterium]
MLQSPHDQNPRPARRARRARPGRAVARVAQRRRRARRSGPGQGLQGPAPCLPERRRPPLRQRLRPQQRRLRQRPAERHRARVRRRRQGHGRRPCQRVRLGLGARGLQLRLPVRVRQRVRQPLLERALCRHDDGARLGPCLRLGERLLAAPRRLGQRVGLGLRQRREPEALSTERLSFAGRAGTLAGKLERPSGEPRAAVLFLHAFTGDKDMLAVARVSRALAERGVAVLRFDATGLGESRGDFAATGLRSWVDDALRAAEALTQAVRAPDAVAGLSLGGTAALAAAARLPSVRGAAVLNAPSRPSHLLGVLPDLDAVRRYGVAPVEVAGRRVRLGRALLEELEGEDPAAEFAATGKRLLVLHAPADDLVPFSEGTALLGGHPGPKRLVRLEGADHLLTRRADALAAAAAIAEWTTGPA